MSRFPNAFEMQAKQSEHDERVRRVLDSDVRYGSTPSPSEDHDPGDEDRRPVLLGPWCDRCGDAFDGPGRDCPRPAPARPYVDSGRGGHMFRLKAEPTCEVTR